MQPNNNNNNTNTRITYNTDDFPVPEKPKIGISFFNINSGEERKCNTEALITAFFNSTNLHPNGAVGQDIGWRLGADTIRTMRAIQDDEDLMERLVTKFQRDSPDDVTDAHILTYMFERDLKNEAKKARTERNKYAEQYEQQIRELDLEIASDTGEPEVDPAELQPIRTTATASPAKRLTPQEQKLLHDAKIREENLANGRPINQGIEGAEEALQAATANDDDVLEEDTDEEETVNTLSDDDAELARLQAEEDAEKAAAAKAAKDAKKPVAKSAPKADNKSNS